MAIVINGSGTLTGVSVGGLPDGIVDTDMLATSAVTNAKIASGAGGQILQVVQGFTDTQVTSSAASYADTGLSANITPASTSSKILVIVNQQIHMYRAGHSYAGLRILRDSTTVIESVFDGNGPLDYGADAGTSGQHFRTRMTYTYLDSPSSTSQLTYKSQGRVHVANQGASIKFNESGSGNNAESYILLMEVA